MNYYFAYENAANRLDRNAKVKVHSVAVSICSNSMHSGDRLNGYKSR